MLRPQFQGSHSKRGEREKRKKTLWRRPTQVFHMIVGEKIKNPRIGGGDAGKARQGGRGGGNAEAPSKDGGGEGEGSSMRTVALDIDNTKGKGRRRKGTGRRLPPVPRGLR